MKVTILLLIGFGLLMNQLAPLYRLDGTPGPFRPLASLGITLDLSSSGPFWMTMWALMGFYEPADLAAAPGASFFTPIALWAWLLISLVLLINLLIAMFSRTCLLYTSPSPRD